MSLELSGMDMGLPGTFHISPGMYASLPMYILYMFLGWTCTYQVHSISYWDICRSTMYILHMSLGLPWDGHRLTRYIFCNTSLECTYVPRLPGMDMYLQGTFNIGPGIYVSLPCTYYICPWDLLGCTWTYQVHSI